MTPRYGLDDALLRGIVEAAPAGIVVAAADGEIVLTNARVEALLGYARGELAGQSVGGLLLEGRRGAEPAGRALFPAERRELGSAPAMVAIRKDGSELAVDVGLSPVSTAQGAFTVIVVREVPGCPAAGDELREASARAPSQASSSSLLDGRWQAFVQDISAREQAERAVRRGEERLQRAQRVAHMGSWDWDLRTGEVVRSPELYRLYGLEPTDQHPPALTLLRHVPEPEREQVFGQIREAVRAGRAYSIEHRAIRPDGEERVFLQQGEPELEGEEVVRYIGTVLDITELRRAEQEKEEALSELRAVLEECPVGITLVRERGQKLEPNAMARQMLGPTFAPSEGLSQLLGKLRSPDGAPLHREDLSTAWALEGKKSQGRELLLEPGDGRKLPIEVSASPVVSPDGKISSVVIVWRDITELKELERLRAEWNSIVAHDLRQPLNNISVFAQLLARQPIEWTAQAQQALSQIRQMTSRLSRMTLDLLDLSRLDAGRLPLDRRAIDLGKLAGECVARASLDSPARSLELRVGGDLPAVEGDPDRLAQVLENLLSNAIKYGAPGTPVEVEVEVELVSIEKQITVSVTNQGKGIAPTEIELVFERFGRARGGKESGVKGVGLGLSIVKGLVEAHGGRIGVESVPGGKTRFWFTLPVGGRG